MTLIEEEIESTTQFNNYLKPGIFICVLLLGFVCNVEFINEAQATQRIEPIQLHPDNPHYFLWRGKPTVLITSGEHYGAVLNRAFDYKKYLKTLESYGFNLTRTFSGAYCEPIGAFKIQNNTLAPAEGEFICPWSRSKTPGYANGGYKFDLRMFSEPIAIRMCFFVLFFVFLLFIDIFW